MREFIKLTFGLLLLLGLLVSAQEDSAAISSAGGASSVEPTPSDVPVDVTSPVVTPTPSEEPVVPVPGTESPSDQGPVDVPSSVASEVSISAQSSPLVSSSDLVEASATSADESSTTDASASATPTEGEDDGEAEEYDFEAREVTPLESRPDVVTEDELLAEAEANLPVMEIPEEDAREIAALEASMFEHFVRNDPVINPEDNITLPESVSNCELGLGKRDMAGGWSGQSNSRVMRRQECRPVTRLDCDLHVWHMLSARGAKRPDTIETRIEESVAYLKSVFEPRGIYFNHVSTNFRQPVSTTADWKTIKKSESKLVKWQTASRAGDHMALNLWLVNNLVPASGVEKAGGNLMGYATFPEMQRWATDGIVMQQSAMGTPASTFVHEVGHWLGLRHTFGNRVDDGETDCLVGDGLRRTTHTRGDRSVIFECEQLPCNEERGVMRIPNFMSLAAFSIPYGNNYLTIRNYYEFIAMREKQSSTRGQDLPTGPSLPTVKLDTTLADLYRQAAPRTKARRIAQVLCGVNSGLPLSAKFPRNTKYLYQDSPFNTTAAKAPSCPDEKAALTRELAMKYLSLIPQRDAFISGSAPVILFHIDHDDPAQVEHDRAEAEATVSVLAADQKPELVFCAGPADIPVQEKGIDAIAYKLMVDGLEKYDLLVQPDVHWFVNSKDALAKSGLPTPKCEIIDLEGHGGAQRGCCEVCVSGGDGEGNEFVIPAACEGARGQWFAQESERILQKIGQRSLPFVLKNQQTFGGAGTYVVRTEEERGKVVDDLREGVLRKLMSSVTEANAHLRPGALILSDLVDEPIGDYGLTFFVTKEEAEPVFLAASEQMIGEGNAWIGSTINYRRQDELKNKFAKLVKEVAAWLRSHDYVGPAGADVLETASESVMDEGVDADLTRHHIVDLNVRTSGSLALPLMKTHFTGRGLDNASSFSISSKHSRGEFVALFRDDFESGKMCILSWYQDRDTGTSLADVAVGAATPEDLKKEMQRVRDATDEVTF
ncbi:hypothetical protein BN1723_015356 [Verticillium longisporum]|uniref:ATP-grasp domain-containing protein n=1 Tax=Verticillium longisporum TaxID=100787 RepID=A0A0G4MWH4_VERLO|nr:hypothetical protein BN1723_015356 [Verticillium longisporum]